VKEEEEAPYRESRRRRRHPIEHIFYHEWRLRGIL
jgi:hypothetical protein